MSEAENDPAPTPESTDATNLVPDSIRQQRGKEQLSDSKSHI
jgi:hypothetical protein